MNCSGEEDGSALELFGLWSDALVSNYSINGFELMNLINLTYIITYVLNKKIIKKNTEHNT